MPRKLKKDDAAKLYRELAAIDPEPTTELSFTSPYTLVVAVALSAQATDVSVNKATGPLFQIADTPEKMVALGEENLGDYIKTIGLWRNKAKNVIALSKLLLEKYDGVVPEDREALETLPGVGRKTANVVCNVAFGQPTIAVDTHIFRVSNRTGLAPGKTPLHVELALEKITPEEFIQHAHHWLILHGRYVCKARTPECWRCGVSEICLFKDKTPPPDERKAIKKKAAKKATKKKAKKTAGKKKPVKRLSAQPKLRETKTKATKGKKKA